MRAQLYLLAAALFDDPAQVDQAAFRALLSRVIYRSPVEAGWVPPLLEIADDHTSEERLAAESSQLFTESSISPWSSDWLQAAPVSGGEEMAELMYHYDLDCASLAGRRPDHLVCQLELMARIVADPDHSARVSEAMLAKHLALWVPTFARALRAAHPSRRYIMASLYLERVLSGAPVVAGKAHQRHKPSSQHATA